MRKFTLFLMSLFLTVGAMAQEYSTTGGNTHKDNYLKSITSTGATENISYSASSHPGSIHNLIPGKIVVVKGESFTIKFVANSLGSSSTWIVREDIRYCHASLFTDFDGNKVFGAHLQRWGNKPPTHYIKGNYDECMNITATISVPVDAASGTSRIRIVYTNAWKEWPSADATNLDKGIAYDIEVEVIDPAVRTDYVHNTGHMNRKQGEERGLTTFTLTDGTNSLVVSNIQDVNSRTAAVYVDKSAQKLTTYAGATLSFSAFGYTGSWMHAYAYVDYNKNFYFEPVNNNGGTTDGEVVSYNYYNGNTITGATGSQSDAMISVHDGSKTLPAFTLPADLEPGEYRMRIKVDWNNIDADYGADDIAVNGGCQCDITLVVEAVEGNEIAKQELYNAIQQVLAYYDTLPLGNGVGKYSSSIENVDAEFAAIYGFYNSITENTAVEEIEAKTARIAEIIASYSLNMPEAGKYYRLKGYSGNYVDAVNLYNATSGQMGMKSAEECNLAGTIFYYYDNHLLNYATGTYTRETREIAPINYAYKSTWNITASSAIGKYNLEDTTREDNKNGAHLHDNDGNRADRCGSNCGVRHDFTIEEVTTLPVSISKAKYATFYAPVAVEVPSDVKAYTVTINGEWATLNEITTGIIPANTGVVLYSENDGTYNFAITTTEATATSALRGSAATTYYTETGTYYALGIIEGAVAFYKDKFNNNRFQNNSHKAYLYVAGTNNAASYSFRFGEGTTGIEEVTGENGEVKAIYDLTGRRVEAITTPGIYIVNGKKVLVK